MQDHDDPPTLNLEGPAGDSVFYRPLTFCASLDEARPYQDRIDQAMRHVEALHDDRLLVLVGALVLENRIDAFLAELMPGYKALRDYRDVSSSVKIQLARALHLCPASLLRAADFVRQIRNDFAHELDVDAFSKLTPGRRQALHDHLKHFGIDGPAQPSEAMAFKTLVGTIALGLEVYRDHVRQLSAFLRSEALIPALRVFVERGARQRAETQQNTC